MVLCTSCPSTYMAGNGRAGHRFSHAPQPMHRVSFITGILGDCSLSGSDGTISSAPVGQWRAQLPHSTWSVSGTQFFFIHTACPICMADLSDGVIFLMAPVGHIFEHRVHSGRQ